MGKIEFGKGVRKYVVNEMKRLRKAQDMIRKGPADILKLNVMSAKYQQSRSIRVSKNGVSKLHKSGECSQFCFRLGQK